MEEVEFKLVEETDLEPVRQIYNEYIRTSTATFRLEPVSAETLKSFIFVNHPRYGAFLIRVRGEVAGFCFLTQFRNQEAYDRTAEIGCYLRPGFTRRGLGTRAVHHLETFAAARGIKTLIASVSGENAASLGQFRKIGYNECGNFRRVGEKFGRVLDVVYFQRLLDQPSSGPVVPGAEGTTSQ